MTFPCTELLSIRSFIPEPTSRVTTFSSTAKTFPRMPLEVITSSPFLSAVIIVCCSLACFCCGRMSTKYMIANSATKKMMFMPPLLLAAWASTIGMVESDVGIKRSAV